VRRHSERKSRIGSVRSRKIARFSSFRIGCFCVILPRAGRTCCQLMDQRIQEIILDLKSYLEYLKGMGIVGLPGSPKKSTEAFRSSSPVPLTASALEEVRKELGDCRRCKLHRTRRTLVFGEGNVEAKLMLIGEGPGYDEDVQGRPFVGRAGQLLTKILQAIVFEGKKFTSRISSNAARHRTGIRSPMRSKAAIPFSLNRSRRSSRKSSVPSEHLLPRLFSELTPRSHHSAEDAMT
jgi:hypothetical protein